MPRTVWNYQINRAVCCNVFVYDSFYWTKIEKNAINIRFIKPVYSEVALTCWKSLKWSSSKYISGALSINQSNIMKVLVVKSKEPVPGQEWVPDKFLLKTV